mmetsp:Transcript_23001/g.32382  ORF Transcript_23001/g.32382 Transcript_23001/m.32382 type:complete len:225 (+) Transcript_23001:381-1055(+)
MDLASGRGHVLLPLAHGRGQAQRGRRSLPKGFHPRLPSPGRTTPTARKAQRSLHKRKNGKPGSGTQTRDLPSHGQRKRTQSCRSERRNVWRRRQPGCGGHERRSSVRRQPKRRRSCAEWRLYLRKPSLGTLRNSAARWPNRPRTSQNRLERSQGDFQIVFFNLTPTRPRQSLRSCQQQRPNLPILLKAMTARKRRRLASPPERWRRPGKACRTRGMPGAVLRSQ